MKRKSRQIDLTKGSIVKGLVMFAIPFLIGNIFQEFYTIVDSIIVGNFCNSTALAAIGSAENPSRILLNIFMGFSSATSIMISQFYGAKDEDGMRRTARTSNAFLLFTTIPLAIFGFLMAPTILSWIRVQEGETMQYAVTYLSILMLGTPAMMGYNQNAGIMRGLGDSESPLHFLIIACIINVVLDLTFVGLFRLGIGGAAAATVIAQGSSWLLSVRAIKRDYPWLQYRAISFSVDGKLLSELVRVGIPLSLNNTVYSLGHTFIAGIINGYGTAAMAGYTCAKRLDQMVVLPLHAISNAAIASAGQNAGAGLEERLVKGIRVATLMAMTINILFCAILFVLRVPFISMFTRDADVLMFANKYLYANLPFYFFYAIFNTINCSMQGVKEVFIPTLNSMLMFWAVRIPTMLYFNRLHDLQLVYLGFPISWAFGMTVILIFYKSGIWKRHIAKKA